MSKLTIWGSTATELFHVMILSLTRERCNPSLLTKFFVKKEEVDPVSNKHRTFKVILIITCTIGMTALTLLLVARLLATLVNLCKKPLCLVVHVHSLTLQNRLYLH